MNSFVPENDLDRAIRAIGRSQSAMPEFYRALAADDLWFLLPYHPELEEQDISIQNGSPLPFAVLKDEQGEVVPLFSCEERVEEALKNGNVPPKTFLAGSMPAKQVLE